MKGFISWPGSQSREVAEALKDWLPRVLQSLRPYVSSEDIDKGTRWSNDISSELASSQIGIVCVTQNSLNAVWTHFEAGALYKALDSTRVIPFLFRVPSPELSEPLRQFQYVTYEIENVRKMIGTINKMCKHSLEEFGLRETFDMWWPRLQSVLDPIPDIVVQKQLNPSIPEENTIQSILEELLDLARDQQRRLSSGRIMAPDDIAMIIRHMDRSALNSHALENLQHEMASIRRMTIDMKGMGVPDPTVDALREKISHMELALKHLVRPARRSSRTAPPPRRVVPVEEALAMKVTSERAEPEPKTSDEIVPWDDGEPPF